MVCPADVTAITNKTPIPAKTIEGIKPIKEPRKNKGKPMSRMPKICTIPKLNEEPNDYPHFSFIICADLLNAAIGVRFS